MLLRKMNSHGRVIKDTFWKERHNIIWKRILPLSITKHTVNLTHGSPITYLFIIPSIESPIIVKIMDIAGCQTFSNRLNFTKANQETMPFIEINKDIKISHNKPRTRQRFTHVMKLMERCNLSFRSLEP